MIEKTETKGLGTNWFGIIMHVCAGLAIIIGLTTTALIEPTGAPQQTVQALWQVKYVVYAIFFEVVALHCKKKS